VPKAEIFADLPFLVDKMRTAPDDERILPSEKHCQTRYAFAMLVKIESKINFINFL
jgi:hypothetical protein